jgi:hypothetical protein
METIMGVFEDYWTKRYVRKAFSRYVSKEVLDNMLKEGIPPKENKIEKINLDFVLLKTNCREIEKQKEMIENILGLVRNNGFMIDILSSIVIFYLNWQNKSEISAEQIINELRNKFGNDISLLRCSKESYLGVYEFHFGPYIPDLVQEISLLGKMTDSGKGEI